MLALALSWLAVSRPSSTVDPVEEITEHASNTTESEQELQEVTLFFPGEAGVLYEESREVPAAPEAEALAAELVRALLAGPTTEGLYAPLAPDTVLRGVSLDRSESIAWIDLGRGAGDATSLGGSRSEILAVYSLVNTLTSNIEEIERVGLLWQGIQGVTFAGHVDTTHPLTASRRWVAQGSGG